MNKLKFLSKIILIYLISLTFFTACEKDDIIPYVYFYERLYLDLPEYQNVQTPGNYIYLPSDRFGYNGIILYCPSMDEYMAFERNCPYNASKENAILDVNDSLNLMICRDCGSRFSLIDGLKVYGPSKYSAKTYYTIMQLNNVLEIYNQ
ncbi:MAG: hypothetical protein LBV69_00900 [Bacteroidales bacterium]|jgi:nitrite reductase/ring-hydroxylating ferredoxin subunit|nr:hypothetical protein [Bacteroidales bacterium]